MKRYIKRFLKVLENGEFHSLDDLSRRLDIPIELLILFSSFLNKWNFADFDEEERKIRLKPDFLQLPQD